MRARDALRVIEHTILRTALTVIDGFVAMEGRDPVHWPPVQMDTIIAGADPAATDATAARMMGFDPHEVWHIRLAHEKGLGEMEDVEVVGARIDDLAQAFKRP